MQNLAAPTIVDVRHRFRSATSDFWHYSRGVLATNDAADIERAKAILAEPYAHTAGLVHDYEIVPTRLTSI